MDLACITNGHIGMCWNTDVCSVHLRTQPHCACCKEILTMDEMMDLVTKAWAESNRV